MKANAKLLQEVRQMRQFAEIIITKASMLERELLGVVPNSSPKGLSQEAIDKALLKRSKNRLKS